MDPTQIVQDAKILLDEIDSEQLYANPWDVSDASVFLNYCCPQCDHKSRDKYFSKKSKLFRNQLENFKNFLNLKLKSLNTKYTVLIRE